MRYQLGLLVTLGLCSISADNRRSPPSEITGEVLDAKDNPISAVIVTAYWKGGSKNTSTDSMGKYTLQLNINEPVDELVYDKPEWNPESIHGLAGTRNHRINKVLYRPMSQLPLLVALAGLAAYESLYYVTDRGRTLDPETRGRYRRDLMRMEVPSEVSERLMQVRRLWEIPPPP